MALVPPRFPDTGEIEIPEEEVTGTIPQRFPDTIDDVKEEPSGTLPQKFSDTGDTEKAVEGTGSISSRFAQPQQPAIASFNYTDLAEGTGVRLFYPIVSELSGSTSYQMVNTTSYRSAETEKHVTSAGTTLFTFDAGEFNLPQKVRGTAFFNVNVYEIGNAGNGFIKVKLQHYDGTTATDISPEYISPALSAAGGDEEAVFIPMTLTETQFKKGDNLRLLVSMVTTHNDVDLYMGHDPSNATSPSSNLSNTQMSIGIPFRLDDVT